MYIFICTTELIFSEFPWSSTHSQKKFKCVQRYINSYLITTCFNCDRVSLAAHLCPQKTYSKIQKDLVCLSCLSFNIPKKCSCRFPLKIHSNTPVLFSILDFLQFSLHRINWQVQMVDASPVIYPVINSIKTFSQNASDWITDLKTKWIGRNL